MLPLKTILHNWLLKLLSYDVRAVEGIVNETSDLNHPNKLFAIYEKILEVERTVSSVCKNLL